MGGYGWISLTTDYGTFDGFVAACHGSIARIAPDIRVIDVTHHVPPADVARGATVLAQTAPYLPESVHCAVVDPGVGTARRGIAIGTPNGVLVGPDNGLLIRAAEALGGPETVVELANKDWFLGDVSRTFHGRDVFAPAAARIAAGAPPARARTMGYPHPVTPPPPPVAAIRARRGSTFADVDKGELLVYEDSAGHVAIAVNNGRAVGLLSVRTGDVVRVAAR